MVSTRHARAFLAHLELQAVNALDDLSVGQLDEGVGDSARQQDLQQWAGSSLEGGVVVQKHARFTSSAVHLLMCAASAHLQHGPPAGSAARRGTSS